MNIGHHAQIYKHSVTQKPMISVLKCIKGVRFPAHHGCFCSNTGLDTATLSVKLSLPQCTIRILVSDSSSTAGHSSSKTWQPSMFAHPHFIEFHAAFSNLEKYFCGGSYILSIVTSSDTSDYQPWQFVRLFNSFLIAVARSRVEADVVPTNTVYGAHATLNVSWLSMHMIKSGGSRSSISTMHVGYSIAKLSKWKFAKEKCSRSVRLSDRMQTILLPNWVFRCWTQQF